MESECAKVCENVQGTCPVVHGSVRSVIIMIIIITVIIIIIITIIIIIIIIMHGSDAWQWQ